jgi:hypothetical protein
MKERTLRKKIFSDGKRFLGGQGERWRAAEATGAKGATELTDYVSLIIFPGFPFLHGGEVSESMNSEHALSFDAKIFFLRRRCGARCGATTWRVEGRDFDGVEPEAVQRELKGPDSECSQSGNPDDGACGPISLLGEY